MDSISIKKFKWLNHPVFFGILFSIPEFLYSVNSFAIYFYLENVGKYPSNTFYLTFFEYLSSINKFFVLSFGKQYADFISSIFGIQAQGTSISNLVFDLICIILLFCIGFALGYIIKLVREKYSGSLFKLVSAFLNSSISKSKWYRCPLFYGILFSIYDFIMFFIHIAVYFYIKDIDVTKRLEFVQQYGSIFEFYETLNYPIRYLFTNVFSVITRYNTSILFTFLFDFLSIILLFFIGLVFGHIVKKFCKNVM
jgi:hypothetical protein